MRQHCKRLKHKHRGRAPITQNIAVIWLDWDGRIRERLETEGRRIFALPLLSQVPDDVLNRIITSNSMSLKSRTYMQKA